MALICDESRPKLLRRPYTTTLSSFTPEARLEESRCESPGFVSPAQAMGTATATVAASVKILFTMAVLRVFLYVTFFYESLSSSTQIIRRVAVFQLKPSGKSKRYPLATLSMMRRVGRS